LSLFTDSLLIAWDRGLDYAQKLVADLSEAQMVVQPQEAMNHPAWILSHLNAYHPAMVAMITGQPFEDPKDHPFGMLSKPEPEGSVYESKEALIAAFEQGHDAVTYALKSASDPDLEAAITLERWQKPFPRVGDALAYIMLLHEATHLGQLSAWRRVQGFPAV